EHFTGFARSGWSFDRPARDLRAMLDRALAGWHLRSSRIPATVPPMTKPGKIALGIAVATIATGVAAAASAGIVRVLAAWTTLACAVASAAYVVNRPGWLGKRDGCLSFGAVVVLPYLAAFGVACRLMRWWRPPDRPTRVAPGLWVSGRVTSANVPPPVG